MITKEDAIAIIKAVADAGKTEIDMISAVRYDADKVPAIRGAVFRALDNLWYDVFPVKLRDQFRESGSTRENVFEIARTILNKE